MGMGMGGTHSRSRRSRPRFQRILVEMLAICNGLEGWSRGTFVTLHDDPDSGADAFVDEFCEPVSKDALGDPMEPRQKSNIPRGSN